MNRAGRTSVGWMAAHVRTLAAIGTFVGLAPLPACLAAQVALPTAEVGQLLSAVLDSVAPRTEAVRGWPSGSAALVLGTRHTREDNDVLEPELVALLASHPQVVATCDPRQAACKGGDYRMLTLFSGIEIPSSERMVLEVSLSGDEGARGVPGRGFLVVWAVTVDRRSEWSVTGVELHLIS